jgi:hypothetical protein
MNVIGSGIAGFVLGYSWKGLQEQFKIRFQLQLMEESVNHWQNSYYGGYIDFERASELLNNLLSEVDDIPSLLLTKKMKKELIQLISETKQDLYAFEKWKKQPSQEYLL